MSRARRGPRKVRGRYLVAVAASATLTVSAAFWMVDRPPSEAEMLVSKFVDALDNRDVAAAAAMTTYPNAATAALNQMFDGLSADGTSTGDFALTQYMDLSDESGYFTLASAWNFGEGKDWKYSAQGSTKKLSVGWRIAWDPATLVPDLTSGGSVRYTRTDAAPPLIFDAANNVLMSERTINAISLDPAQTSDPVASTAQLADVIDVVAPLITSESMLAELNSSGGAPITAVTLRDDDFAVLEDDLRAVPGVVVSPQPKLIVDDRRITSPVLDSLRSAWQEGRDATAGWAVDTYTVDGIGERRVGFQGPGGPDLHATLDPRVQLAAENAVVMAGSSASIVALSTSTGAILAAAQNSYANEQGDVVFGGSYPAGTASELLKAAQSDRGDDSAEDAAAALGLGISYSMPGLDAYTGTPADSRSAIDGIRAVSTASGDEATVTPFGLAQMAAAISRGSAPTPTIVAGQTAVANRESRALGSDAANRLRGILADSSRSSGLDTFDGVQGFAGESGDDRFVLATSGDVAFAVYIEDADGGDQAVRMTSRLLQEMANPVE
ncbi:MULTISPECIES: NTF2-like N-terminal transpeptidase domain-containing protein [unclassified Rhodococcus (in: high G+C Gram-positive bacteria)]|uniref:NTF2-like N-terminal transpeptidase domain-containing protein n=1 Tax=unclassified Rhodococcus (in: high G+C Gram-positive bacteria) TaxID=192944 RepID=UPI00165D4EDD|nr:MULTISPECIES: NTF2-like N-terminal transpeptidase domain-containing protein [unclassified Rhodococcus (in: high G+C Gram-positive bacteria)]MDI9926075.1 NTF2-like N-terminal transpeptidase domain-containing protein [Rhodococcus sp. IEGM 1341]